jgi:phosphatidylglycerophosphatase A
MPSLSKLPPGLRAGDPAVVIATWFGAGRMPFASGTWGSAAALPFAYVLLRLGGPLALGAAALVLFALGIWASGVYCREAGIGDPGAIVIDEVVGQFLTLTVTTAAPLWFAIGFFLFRLFDVVKPWPASWADREVKGGLGVMLDDVFAAVYSAAVLWGIQGATERWLS